MGCAQLPQPDRIAIECDLEGLDKLRRAPIVSRHGDLQPQARRPRHRELETTSNLASHRDDVRLPLELPKRARRPLAASAAILSSFDDGAV